MLLLGNDVSKILVPAVSRRPDTYWFGFDVVNQILTCCAPKGITQQEQIKKMR